MKLGIFTMASVGQKSSCYKHNLNFYKRATPYKTLDGPTDCGGPDSSPTTYQRTIDHIGWNPKSFSLVGFRHKVGWGWKLFGGRKNSAGGRTKLEKDIVPGEEAGEDV